MEILDLLLLLLLLGLAYVKSRFPKSSIVKWIRILIVLLKSLF